MTNKELFIKVIERARKEAIALNEFERALGDSGVENHLTACFSFCDEICGSLPFEKDPPNYFYEEFWAFINNGSISYVVDGSYRLIATAEEFWDFWKEEAYNA